MARRYYRTRATSARWSYAAPESALVGAPEFEITLADMLALPAPSARNRAAAAAAVHNEGSDFFGGVSRANVLQRIAAYVPDDKAARMRERLSDDIDVRKTSRRNRTRTNRAEGDCVGDAFEYTLWRRGAVRDQRWWEVTETVAKRKRGIVTVHVNLGMRALESETALEYSGACALALTDVLESLGYRVEIFGTNTSYGHRGPRAFHYRVALKGADERLSEQATAIMCRGGVSRLLRFIWQCSLTGVSIDGGMGYSCEYRGSHKADAYVPHAVESESDAVAWIEETVKRLAEHHEHAEDATE